MAPERLYCVISHTHWDREWYEPFELFRIRLVELVDNLLAILEENPTYIFHLDAQTSVLDDYTEIRPHERARLERFVKNGQLLVGPWYVQNDFYLVSGESTVRNLQLGRRRALEYGHCDLTGYTPDQFGLISQLPQILNGFGITDCVFGRGYTFLVDPEADHGWENWQKRASEFLWRDESGAEVLALHMPRWYNNAQRFSEDVDKSMRYLEIIEEGLAHHARTPYRLLMNGVDHLQAQENLLPILEAMNERLPEGTAIRQMRFPEYSALVRDALESPESIEGELRYGPITLQGSLSSRVYLKQANAAAETALAGHMEPLYAMLPRLGFPAGLYPADYLDYLWRLLILNHPHDSICGCSQDAVHRHMEDRFERIRENTDQLLFQGMRLLAQHVRDDSLAETDYLLTAVNTRPAARSALTTVTVDLPKDDGIETFALFDAEGREVPYTILSRKEAEMALRSPINLPGRLETERLVLRVPFENVPPLGYTTLRLAPGQAPAEAPAPLGFENAFVRLDVDGAGRVTLTHKPTGATYADCLWLEDREDAGDSYNWRPGKTPRPIDTRELAPEAVETVRDDALESVVRIRYRLALPAAYDHDAGRATEETVENPVEILLRVERDNPVVGVETTIDNRSRDHRLRLVLETGLAVDEATVGAPYDVLRRRWNDPLSPAGCPDKTQPMTRFVDLSDAERGVAVLTPGLYEYEHLPEAKSCLAITLVRGNRFIGNTMEIPKDETWIVPENQTLRRLTLRVGLLPHAGDALAAHVPAAALDEATPPLTLFTSMDPTKFEGGRVCVQDTQIAEIFRRPDPYAGVALPRRGSLLTVDNPDVLLTACKKPERGEGILLRLVNTRSEPQEAVLEAGFDLARAERLDLKEDRLALLPLETPRRLRLRLAPKEILTLGLH